MLEMWAGTLTVVFLSMKLSFCFMCLQGSTKAEDGEQYDSLGGLSRAQGWPGAILHLVPTG